MVGLDWLDLDFFFHHFFQGSVPKFEFRPKMRTQILSSPQKCAPGGLGAAAASQKRPRGPKEAPRAFMGPFGSSKDPRTPPWGQGGAPLVWAIWALCEFYVSPLWAPFLVIPKRHALCSVYIRSGLHFLAGSRSAAAPLRTTTSCCNSLGPGAP